MLTLTSARDYVRDGIHMNAVDTGWITDEDPSPTRAASGRSWLRAPLDVVDGAARVLDPFLSGLATGEHAHGRFFRTTGPRAGEGRAGEHGQEVADLVVDLRFVVTVRPTSPRRSSANSLRSRWTAARTADSPHPTPPPPRRSPSPALIRSETSAGGPRAPPCPGGRPSAPAARALGRTASSPTPPRRGPRGSCGRRASRRTTARPPPRRATRGAARPPLEGSRVVPRVVEEVPHRDEEKGAEAPVLGRTSRTNPFSRKRRSSLGSGPPRRPGSIPGGGRRRRRGTSRPRTGGPGRGSLRVVPGGGPQDEAPVRRVEAGHDVLLLRSAIVGTGTGDVKEAGAP